MGCRHYRQNKTCFKTDSPPYFIGEEMKEIWQPIKGYEGLYEISNLGRVKALPKIVRFRYYEEKILKSKINKTQEMVGLKVNQVYTSFCVARLVALAFVQNRENKPFVLHKDGNTFNNKASNLKWATMQEINKLAGIKKKPAAKTIEKLVAGSKRNSKKIKCIETGKIYSSINEASREMGVSPTAIRYNCQGKTASCCGMQWRFVF